MIDKLNYDSINFALLLPYIEKCLSYLEDNWNDDGGCPGDYPGDPSNTWSTAGNVYALLINDRGDSKQVKNGIQWLMKIQNENGSFPFLKEHKDDPEHEYIIPSAYVMLAFYKYLNKHTENNDVKTAFKKVIEYIIKNKEIEETKDGKIMYSWCFQRKEQAESCTFETAIVIRFLNIILNYFKEEDYEKEIQKTIEGGINWLLYAFNSNNKWGRSPNDNNKKELPTTYAILALNQCKKGAKEITNAISYLKKGQREDGSWKEYFEYRKLIDLGSGIGRIIHYCPTPNIIEAIFLEDKKELDKSKINAIFWLTKSMEKGYVEHDMNPNITIWPTRDCILVAKSISKIATTQWLEQITSDYNKIYYKNRNLERENNKLKSQMLTIVDQEIKKKYNPLLNWIVILNFLAVFSITTIVILILYALLPNPVIDIPIIYSICLAIISIINKIIWDKKIQ